VGQLELGLLGIGVEALICRALLRDGSDASAVLRGQGD
jgi:hypothetical protein